LEVGDFRLQKNKVLTNVDFLLAFVGFVSEKFGKQDLVEFGKCKNFRQ
jgi:hypothetical protein